MRVRGDDIKETFLSRRREIDDQTRDRQFTSPIPCVAQFTKDAPNKPCGRRFGAGRSER